MAGIFGILKSKKKSDWGPWVDDMPLSNCMVCDAPFSVSNRKHHCRMCGLCACDSCTTNREFLESSRSGQPKRVCDWCFFLLRSWDDETPVLATEGKVEDVTTPHILQQVRMSREDALATVRSTPVDGRWTFVWNFHYWPTAIAGADPKAKEEKLVSVIRAVTQVDLASKGAAIRGVMENFSYVCQDVRIQGAIHTRTTGRVEMTLKCPSVLGGPARDMQLQGWMTADGNMAGSLSGPAAEGDETPSLFGTYLAVPAADPVQAEVDLSDVTEEEEAGDQEDPEAAAARREALAAQRAAATAAPAAAAAAAAAAGGGAANAAPQVPKAVAVRMLKETNLVGTWQFVLKFTRVDIAQGRDAPVPSMAGVDGFRASGAAALGRGRGRGGARRKSTRPGAGGGGGSQTVSVGSRLPVVFDLSKKGAGYIKGTGGVMGQFGEVAGITGSLQRGTGKVTIQVQAKEGSVTTSFNFSALINEEGEMVGSFTGCEIAKEAGSVAGTFVAHKEGDGRSGDEEGDAEEEAAGGDEAEEQEEG